MVAGGQYPPPVSLRLLVIGALAASLVALPTAAEVHGADRADFVQQVGTYASLIAPDYTGLGPISRVLSPNALGLGTFDRLDGELMILGGAAYRVGTDGTPRRVSSKRTSPFVQAVPFAPNASGPVAPGTTCTQLQRAVDDLAKTTAGVVAVRVRGTFTDLVTRSVPEQSAPYLPLADVVANQVVFPLGKQRAVLMGFRTGPDMAGTGAPGLHLHALTADRAAGGHVLSCVAGSDVHLSVQRTAGTQVHAARSAGVRSLASRASGRHSPPNRGQPTPRRGVCSPP